MIDDDDVGLKEKLKDTRYINKRHLGLIAPPNLIRYLAVRNPSTKGHGANPGILLLKSLSKRK